MKRELQSYLVIEYAERIHWAKYQSQWVPLAHITRVMLNHDGVSNFAPYEGNHFYSLRI